MACRTGEDATAAEQRACQQLITMTRKSQTQVTQACAALRGQAGATAKRLVQQFEQVLPLLIGRSARRSAGSWTGRWCPKEKIVSLFEPHTQIIMRHKAGKPVFVN